MARPKKDAPTGDDTPITLSYSSYMQMAEFLAGTLTQQSDNQSRLVALASTQLSTTQALLSQVKIETQAALQRIDHKESSVASEQFPNIHRLLTTDPLEIPGADAKLPIAPRPPDTKPVKQKKPKKERDPNAPKRPLTAFFLFLQEKRDDTAKSMPNAKPGDIQKKMTDIWNSLDERDMKPYKDRYEENMKRYKHELKEYNEHLNKVLTAEADTEEPMHVPDEPLNPTEALETESSNVDELEVEEVEEEQAANGTKALAQESSESSSESEEETPPPKRETKKSAAKSTKETSPKKKRNAPAVEEKKSKKEKETVKAASPEVSKKKRKAEAEEATKAEKKKKRRSQGYAGNTDDY